MDLLFLLLTYTSDRLLPFPSECFHRTVRLAWWLEKELVPPFPITISQQNFRPSYDILNLKARRYDWMIKDRVRSQKQTSFWIRKSRRTEKVTLTPLLVLLFSL